ncbi:ABC transporter ATP-binding protein [Spirosoma luteum]|uniref:ABC transporter ATP-binding protein n=1 Tax=Spirosoma luteum TaxID=431553 RepID=UPI000381DA19|nr:ABC transporter ATP-binding protein [Spirosoma luteum]
MLTATKLTKSFSGDVKAVRNVSITLQPGQIVALVGASGSGKSTLLNLLAGLTDADTGEVRFNDERVLGPSEKLVPGHESIRLVHQEYQLMPNVSVRENIAYALRFFEKNYRTFRVNELLKLCRLTDVQDRLPRQVSGGEKQRTAIARAIADKPSVLLLDEPFSHLDLPNRLLVRDLLFDLVRHQSGETPPTSCLFVTHDTTDALSIADVLGILRDGKLVQLGAPAELYHRPVSAYAARMTGPVTIVKAKYVSLFGRPVSDNPDALVCLRPEQISLSDVGTPGTVRAVYFRGSTVELDVDLSRYVSVRLFTSRSDVQVGQLVNVTLVDAPVWYLRS